MDPGKCLTVTAHKIRPSFPWETEGRNSLHSDKHEVHKAKQQWPSPVHAHINTHILRQGDGQEAHSKLCGTLGSPTGAHGGMSPCNLIQESKIGNCACQTYTEAFLPHETTPQCDHLHLSILDITVDHADQNHPLHSTGLFRKESKDSCHLITGEQTVNSCQHWAHSGGVWHCLSQTPYLLFLYLRQPAQPHGDDNITLMHGVITTVFCHGHCLSHHTKWSLHEHQQVLGTGFLCTAWLSHSCGEWISVVPHREAVFFQNK